MKKIITTLFGIFCFLNFTNVKAYYNGEGGGFTNLTGTKECGTTPNCQYNNFNVFYLKLTLYYIDNGEFKQQIGQSYYLSRTKDKGWLKTLGIKEENIYDLGKVQTELDKVSEQSNTRYEQSYKLLKKHFGDQEENVNNVMNDNLRTFLNKITGGNYEDVLIEETEYADPTGKKPATKGYRLIIEPSISYLNVNGRGTTFTVKGAAIKRRDTPGFNFSSMSLPLLKGEGFDKVDNTPQSQFLFTSFKDVGISGESRKSCTDGLTLDELADLKNGCGYNIIDVGKFVSKKCYIKEIKNGNLKCTNVDQNNTATFTETYTKKQCTTEEYKTNKNTEYGKLIKENENCNVYCIESAYASFPGHISGSIAIETIPSRGTYFTWPSRIGNPGMTMNMKTTLSCHIIQKNGKTCNSSNIEELKNAVENELKSLKFNAELKAGTNKVIDGSLEKYNENYNDKEFNNVKIDKNGISNKFEITKETYFKIPNNKNRLYNRESDNVFDGTKAASNYVFDRTEGVVSLNKNDDVSKIYDLEIKNVTLGSGNQFGKLISDYVCHYQVKIGDCVCPEGTLKEGDSLYNYLVSGKTCSELQQTLCNVCECPPNSSNEYEEILIGEDATTEKCEQLQKKQCYNRKNYCIYKGQKIDTTDCIKTQKEKNKLTEEEAIVYCDQVLCPECIDSSGKKVDISSCLATGNSYNICEILYCPRNICPPPLTCEDCSQNCSWNLIKKTKTSIEYKKKCSDGENCGYIKLACPGGNEKMNNAETCIQKQLSDKLKGNTISNALTKKFITENDVKRAFAACEEEVCPYSGRKIIYRQIDLNDPFPGKKHQGTNNNIQFSNNNQSIKNRTPGDNWNSETAIKTKILNARGVKGYELYDKNPLYIIKLTPDTIKKIREYNKKNSYDDFNLICTNKNKSANCISDFLHKGIDNLNARDFVLASYGNKISVNACYNMNYDESGFNACYNNNN